MSARFTLFVLCLALGVAGCGQKGPLVAPPGDPADAPLDNVPPDAADDDGDIDPTQDLFPLDGNDE